MSQLRDTIKQFRVLNLFLTGIAVGMGSYLAFLDGKQGSFADALLAVFSAMMIAGSMYLENNLKNRKEDRINHPERDVTFLKKYDMTVTLLRYGLLIIGVGLAFFVRYEMGLFAICNILLLAGYNHSWKGSPLIGNLVVSIVSSTPFLYGALAWGSVSSGVLPALLALPIHFVREMVKDVEDILGDQYAGQNTFAVRFGRIFTMRFAGILMLATASLIPVPYFLKLLDFGYLALAFSTVALPLAYWGGGAMVFPDKTNCSKIQKGLKWIMIPGMISIFAGKL